MGIDFDHVFDLALYGLFFFFFGGGGGGGGERGVGLLRRRWREVNGIVFLTWQSTSPLLSLTPLHADILPGQMLALYFLFVSTGSFNSSAWSSVAIFQTFF